MKFLLCFLIWLLASNSHATSIQINSPTLQKWVMPLLDSKPEFKELLLCHFDIVSDPEATRLGSVSFPKLEGRRIGPYSMWANLRMGQKSTMVMLTINTSTQFFDEDNRVLPSGAEQYATKVVEQFEDIQIAPPVEGQLDIVPGGLKYSINRDYCENQE